MKNKSNLMFPAQRRALAIPLAFTLAFAGAAQAADLYWDNNGGTANDWGSVANWSTDVAGGATPGAIPGGSDVATFSATPIVGTAQTVNLNDTRTVSGINIASTVTQGITIQGGGTNRTLAIGSSGVTNAANGSGSLTIGSNVAVVLSGSQSWATNGSANIIVSNGVSGLSTPTFTNNGTGSGLVVFAGSIASSVSKIVQDSATSMLALRNANYFTGGVEVKQGVLYFGNVNENLGNGTLTLGVNGGTGAVTAQVQDNSNGIIGNAIVLTTGHTGPITIRMTEDQVGVSHSKTFTGGITGTNSFTIQNDGGDDNLNFSTTAINNVGTITHTGTATTGVTTINAVIGSNVTGLTQSGPARLVLNAANTHGGTTTVNGGTLQLGNVNALQNTTLNTGASGSQQVTFTVGGTNIYNLGGLTGGDDLAIGGNTLSIGSNNQNTTYTGGISGVSGGLTKVGNGTLNLNGTNSYAGATAINGGTLAVNGSITSAGATMVSAGTLFVTGSLTSDVTVSDTATLGGGGTVGALSFGGGSFFDIFLAIGGNPLDATTISFAATGFGIDNLRSNGAAVDWGSITDGTYTLIDGTLDSTNLDNFGLANAYDLGGGRSAYFQSGSLQLTVIPEPRAALLGGLGLLALLRRRR